MPHFSVIYDACVLYPAPLRDLLLRLAITDLFCARWTDQILDECFNNLIANKPSLNKKKLQRTRELMNKSTLDVLVTGYENLIDGLKLPDSNDRHILAAAIQAQASVIVTFNLKDFPPSFLEKYEIESQHPDDFIRSLIDLSMPIVCATAKRHRASLKNPPKTVEEYLDALERQQLAKTVQVLREYRDLL